MLHLPAVLRPPCTPTGLLRHFKEYRVARYGPPLLQVQHMYSDPQDPRKSGTTMAPETYSSSQVPSPLYLPPLSPPVPSPCYKEPRKPPFLFFRLTSPWRLNILVCTSFYRLDLHLSTNSIFGDLSFLFSCLWHLQTITILDIQSSINASHIPSIAKSKRLDLA